MIIINGENDDHLEMLEGGVMRQLLDEKWKAFARVRIDNWKKSHQSCIKLVQLAD